MNNIENTTEYPVSPFSRLQLSGRGKVKLVEGNTRRIYRPDGHPLSNEDLQMIVQTAGTLHLGAAQIPVGGPPPSHVSITNNRGMGNIVNISHSSIGSINNSTIGSITQNGRVASIGGNVASGAVYNLCIECPKLPSINIDGDVQLQVSGFSGQAVDYSLSNRGKITHEGVNAPMVDLVLSGDGEITVSGQAKELYAIISGNGDIRAAKCTSAFAMLKISGNGNISAHVTESLDANISGNGDIEVSGNPPKCQRTITGLGDITVTP